ncbi:beta-ketoacyl synthase N-terminal-like domain-containing protein [Chondromyces apiculatus]|uniref:Malonyl CoA-acyl carrier protein transacylase n=1 Tax=Chondromyces apiculatus DSM 436 TaxID=1192034 RepID=A0A017T5N6_9BACT|nr:beta-ketoacyl synthase N-terminal-like domain-containing protein [Chondromyces apiculatus]EYF04558.1 Malonyl CoA-acyl carrier protein transacylase [Chondromyces apiculatus DSM 436]
MADDQLILEALHTIQRLNEKIASYEAGRRVEQDVAVVGMSCQFPGAPNLKVFWDRLCARYDGVTHYPPARLGLLGLNPEELGTDVTRIFGGYLEGIDLFDAELFGISPREARCMDPQQRLLLMNVHQALVDAELLGRPDLKNTGVFISHYPSQYMRAASHYDPDNALFLVTGNALSISANRISYHYDLSGPSLVIDTACSSSLVAVDIACQYLAKKVIDHAIVGGISLNLNPVFTRLLQDSSMLAPDGKCKTFDTSANGYVPGEGVGVLVLSRLSDSRARGAKVYSVIAASYVNQDGKSNGLTAPNGVAQEQVIARAFQRASIAPSQVQYVETHGTGTYLGDPVEIEALGNVVNQGRAPGRPCVLGCLKTNIGHLEPAAGIAGLIKASLCIHLGKIPGNNHLTTVNPLLRMERSSFVLPDRTLDWTDPEKIAGVSSFGFGGVNGHVVLRSPPEDLRKGRGDLLATYPVHPFNAKSYWLQPTNGAKKPDKSGGTGEKLLDFQAVDAPPDILRVLLRIEGWNLLGIGDTGNFHIGFYIETIYRIFAERLQARSILIHSIEFLRLLYVSRPVNTLIQVAVREGERGAYEFDFYFRYEAEGSTWVRAAKASVSPASGEDCGAVPPRALGSAPITLDEGTFYERYTAMGYPGMGFVRVVQSSEIHADESFSTLRLSFDASRYGLGVHPGFLDAVLQPGFLMKGASTGVLHMTTVMRDISIRGPLTSKEHYGLYTRLLPSAEPNRFAMSWSVYDAKQEVVIACRETTLQSLTQNESALESLAAFDPGRVERLTPRHLLEEIGALLETDPAEIPLDRELLELGMDSLMIMKLQSILDRFSLPINNLFEVTVRDLQRLIVKHHPSWAEDAPPASPGRELVSPSFDKDRWVRGHEKPGARVRLYCFPYGHLSASMFRNWVKTFPDHIEVRPIELPGRGDRLKERPLEHLSDIAERLTDMTRDDLQRPYAMLGHSAGTLLAYAWCSHLQRRGLPAPQVLFAGAFSAPCLPANPVVVALKETYRNHGISHIPTLDEILDPRNHRFVERVIDALLDSMNSAGLFSLTRDFIRAQLHAIVATFRTVETFDPGQVSPLHIPIVALHGRQDAQVSEGDMRAWERLTTRAFLYQEFAGNHSFINAEQNEGEVMAHVVGTLSALSLGARG